MGYQMVSHGNADSPTLQSLNSHVDLVLLPSLLNDLSSPRLDLRQTNARSNMSELREVNLVRALILNHLQEQLHLVDVVDKVGLEGLVLLIFLENALNILAGQCTPRYLAEESGGDVFHNGGLTTSLLGLGDVVVDRGDISDERLSHIVDQGHLGAAWNVELS